MGKVLAYLVVIAVILFGCCGFLAANGIALASGTNTVNAQTLLFVIFLLGVLAAFIAAEKP